jgi:hypothetical protein
MLPTPGTPLETKRKEEEREERRKKKREEPPRYWANSATAPSSLLSTLSLTLALA